MNTTVYNTRKLVPWSSFDYLFDGPYLEADSETTWSATVNIQENDKEIVLTADLPDVADEDLDVKVEEDVLTLRAKRQPEEELEGERFHRLERVYGSFHRSFKLPENVTTEKIKAGYDKGVLRVTLPKQSEKKNKSRQIRIH